MRLEYYALEFNPDILGKGQPENRNRLGAQGPSTTREILIKAEHQSPNGPEQDDQSNVSEAQGEALDDCQSSASATGNEYKIAF